MDKYKKTAGLNYLSENSYKGDGSPGMVMGIASDARGDTNTYEGLGDIVSKGIHKSIDYLTSARFRNIAGEKPGIDVFKSNPLVPTSRQVVLTFKNGYGVSIVPEYKLGGKRGMEIIDGYYEVLVLRKAEPGNTEPKGPDNKDGPIIKLKNGDLYTSAGENMRIDDAGLDDVLIKTKKGMYGYLAGLDEAGKPTTNSKHSSERDLKKYDPAHGHTKPEGGNPQVCHLCKGEGCEPCGHTGEEITKVRNDPKVDETKHSELDDIKRLSGLTEAFAWDELEEAKRKKRPDLDHLDDEDEEEKPEDPDSDKVGHILMQLKKAKDVDGDHPIKFLDGTKIKLPVADIDLFMDKYMDMKPLDREKMQEVAIMSKEKFDTILSFFQPKHGKPEKSIYENEEMLSEAQFDEAAGEKDACYHKVKSRYKVWPSAYASGALVKCRKVGASNWGTGGKKKK